MIGVGVAGYGYWGPNLARAVAESGVAKVEMIADPSPEARKRAAPRHPAARMTGDIGEMLRDPQVDAVMIATPVQTHFELALAALRAGKHVLVEKPMTETVAQAVQLVDEAARRGLTLMVDHTFVYTPAIRKISQLLEDGELGDLYYYDSTRVNLGLFQRDVNVIWDLAVHDFAIMDHLLDQSPVAISACAAGFLAGSPENMAHVTVHYDGGTMANLNVNWLAPVKIRQTLIGGSRKMVVYDDMETSEKIKVYDRGASCNGDPYEHLVSYRLGDMHAPALSTKEALLTEVEEFVRAIDSRTAPLTDGEGGLRVVELLAAASLSTRQRGHPVDLVTRKVAS
ncbi:Gfo/Idh/MocA family protein [Salipiger mucosus]|uniref:Putative oxidoreductase n=1 Tax=Salipiger mucosus DSM 16094 TaxID=1123237 RepID=S9S6C3_9RHOB|nr:Gfo/Idh/MocA family oxidoreductase [Salipiger mucosus]EPX85745.1 Putative oxidoreductase [Salipiger mucosus DSM 16094]